MTDAQDRRRQERKKDHLALTFYYAQERCEVTTLDVSRSGALVKAPVMFPSGTLLILEYSQLCAQAGAVRLLARVVRVERSVSDRVGMSAVGVAWVRAYAAGGKAALAEFLVDKLGWEPEVADRVQSAASGDAVFDFPAAAVPVESGSQDTKRGSDLASQKDRFLALQRGRFRVSVPVIYSVHNMYTRGTLIALGADGLAVATKGAVPPPLSKVSVRYPLELSPHAPRVLLFCETEMVVDPAGADPGFFSARTLGIDELDCPGIFKMHLRALTSRFRQW